MNLAAPLGHSTIWKKEKKKHEKCSFLYPNITKASFAQPARLGLVTTGKSAALRMLCSRREDLCDKSVSWRVKCCLPAAA